MRALIIASASRATVIDPSRTCCTNCFTRSFPRSRAAGSFPNRPSSTIWSSRLFSSAAPAAADDGWCTFCASAIASLHLGLQPFQLVLVRGRFSQNFVQLLVALQRAPQIRQLGAQLEQLPQRLHLRS